MEDEETLLIPLSIHQFGYFLDLALSDDNREEEHDDSVQSIE